MKNKKSQMKKILVIDDHPLLRRGLLQLLSDSPGYEVCAEAADLETALIALKKKKPDVVILDIRIQERDGGYDLLRVIRDEYPDVKTLVFSAYEEPLYVERALKHGANGYVVKTESPDSLLAAIDKICEGHMSLSEEMTVALINHCIHKADDINYSLDMRLTRRETEVLRFIGDGLNTREIGQLLYISVKTVESHRANIKRKLKLRNVNELIKYAVQVKENLPEKSEYWSKRGAPSKTERLEAEAAILTAAGV